jgi:hypothetical protein
LGSIHCGCISDVSTSIFYLLFQLLRNAWFLPIRRVNFCKSLKIVTVPVEAELQIKILLPDAVLCFNKLHFIQYRNPFLLFKQMKHSVILGQEPMGILILALV